MKKNLSNVKKIHFRPDFYYETAQDFCFHLGFNDADIANLTGYSRSTVARWLKMDTHPRWLLPLLYAAAGGVLQKGFYGWRLNNGKVAAPGLRYGLTTSQVETYTWHLSQLHQAWSTIRHLQTPADTQAEKNRLQPVILRFPRIF